MADHLAHRLQATVAAHGSRTATRIRRDDAWETQTYAASDRAC